MENNYSALTFRQKIVAHLLQITDAKLHALQIELDEIAISISNETKSTAGDKYETSRAMLQIEQVQLNKQKLNILEQKTMINSIDTELILPAIGIGSLVKTNHGYLFLSIGLGKIMVDETPVVILSLLSPLGKLLGGLKVNDQFSFLETNYTIEALH
ncbi:MAG: hypothetical protein ACHQFW_06860 [Chitinophagales bacterium]